MDKLECFRSISADVARGELAFSTGAGVALKVLRALDDPACQLETAAKLVQAEPLLAARVVAMANAAAYNRSGREITDVRTSVMRLGFRTVRTLATALVTRQLAGSSPSHQDAAAQLWEHTAHVASLSHVIARRFTRVDPETAMFVGIIHEVGGFYLLSRLKDFPGLLDGGPGEWMEAGEALVGRAVLKVLYVPEVVQNAIETYWAGYLAIPPATFGDTLLLAKELAPVGSPLHPLGPEQGKDKSSGFDMVIGEDALASMLAESAEEIESLTGALKF